MTRKNRHRPTKVQRALSEGARIGTTRAAYETAAWVGAFFITAMERHGIDEDTIAEITDEYKAAVTGAGRPGGDGAASGERPAPTGEGVITVVSD